MSSHSSRTTTDHDEIRRWAEARGARPACIKGTGGGDDVGMIRLDLPGFSGAESLQEISWDQWFDAFDENGLALVFQEETASGERSNFNKLVSREGVASHEPSRRSTRPSREPAVQQASGDESLKEREYRDAEGQVHHHTRKYMDEHRGDSRRDRHD